MHILYADLCEMGERSTRENGLGIILVPEIMGIRKNTEEELKMRGTLAGLIVKWENS